MKLWGSRFNKDPSELMKQFNQSFSFDKRLYAVDIQGSLAYASALHEAGLITDKELISLQSGLQKIRNEFDSGEFEEKAEDEDVHTAVERRLSELIGEIAGKLHMGRSRNDQVALDVRLYCMGEIAKTINLLKNLQHSLIAKAEEYISVIMPGYTHLQPAQPILISHWIMSFFWMFERDKARLKDALTRTTISPLGSGALAGNPFTIDREKIAKELGMSSISMNSLDAVSDRDFAAEFLFALSMIAVHISHLAEDIILISSPAFHFLQIGEAFSTGSSLMPQKRNPDSMELARGKAGRVISDLVNLLFVLKGLPSSYNKDLQEDKEALFDGVDTIKMVLPIVTGVINNIKVFPEKIKTHLNDSLLATDIADYLVGKGVPFREAHHHVGIVVKLAEAKDIPLSDVSLSELKNITPKFNRDVQGLFDMAQSVGRKDGIGGTAPAAVKKQINRAKVKLAN